MRDKREITVSGGADEVIIDDTQGFEEEPRIYSDTAPCLRSEQNGLKTVVIGSIESKFESANRVYDKDGLAPTLSTCGGGGQQPKVIDEKAILTPKRTEYGKAIRKDYESGTIKESRHNMTQLEPRTDGIANTLTTVQKDNVLLEKRKYRIRKLTPRECWKLMDFSDEDFEKAEKVNSNTQLYKQAGNSIVVNVLVAIMGQLLQGKEDIYKKGGD